MQNIFNASIVDLLNPLSFLLAVYDLKIITILHNANQPAEVENSVASDKHHRIRSAGKQH